MTASILRAANLLRSAREGIGRRIARKPGDNEVAIVRSTEPRRFAVWFAPFEVAWSYLLDLGRSDLADRILEERPRGSIWAIAVDADGDGDVAIEAVEPYIEINAPGGVA